MKPKFKDKGSKGIELADGEDLGVVHKATLLETQCKPWMREECGAVVNEQSGDKCDSVVG